MAGIGDLRVTSDEAVHDAILTLNFAVFHYDAVLHFRSVNHCPVTNRCVRTDVGVRSYFAVSSND